MEVKIAVVKLALVPSVHVVMICHVIEQYSLVEYIVILFTGMGFAIYPGALASCDAIHVN